MSPRWVPILMFTLLGLGLLIIFLNYLGLLPAFPFTDGSGGETDNRWLVVGLAGILGGIITATQYH